MRVVWLLAAWLGVSVAGAAIWAVAARRLRRRELLARLDEEAGVRRRSRLGESSGTKDRLCSP
jgi:hypothetical protein